MTKASDIAQFLGAPLTGEDIAITRAATLDSAGEGAVVFVKKYDPAYLEKLSALKDVLVLAPKEGLPESKLSVIALENPRLAFARVLEKFFTKPKPAQLIAPTAQIASTARLAANVRVGHYSVIGENVVIGEATEIRNHVVLAAGVKIGRDCLIKSGAVIGEEGFGFEKNEQGINIRIPHIGSVTIGDRVEVGALTSICCGTVDDTLIGDDTKIDDHVFIAHNVKVGKNCTIIAAAEVSGGVKLGENAWIAPGATIINAVEIGADALVGVGAVITKNVEPGAVMGGARATLIRYQDKK